MYLQSAIGVLSVFPRDFALLHLASLIHSYVTNTRRYVFAQTLPLNLVLNVVFYSEYSIMSCSCLLRLRSAIMKTCSEGIACLWPTMNRIELLPVVL